MVIPNVPNLRFPGFEGQWEKKRLSDIAEFKAGYAFKSADMLSEKSTYQLLKMSNVYQSELRLDRNPSYWGNINDKQREFLLQKGDSILTLTGTFGKRDFGYSVIIKEDNKYLLNQRLVSLREKKGISANGFINQILSNQRFLFKFFAEAKGGTGNQTNVGTEDVKNIVLNFPNYLEQVKIASFLSLIEERIQTQSKIIEHNKSLIKGILKSTCLTSKTWKRQYLKDILTERKETNTKRHPVFSVSVSRGLINQIEYLGRSFAAKNTDNYNVANFGDLIYTKSPTGNFPYGIIKQSFVREKVAISPLYAVYEPQSKEIGIILHYHFSEPINVSNYLHRIIQKGAKNTISVTNQQFLTNAVFLPTDKKEIKNLARLLQVFSDKIENEQTILNRLSKQKQYFLQQMFI